MGHTGSPDASSAASAHAELLTGRLPWANDSDWLSQVAGTSGVMSGFGSSVATNLPGHGKGVDQGKPGWLGERGQGRGGEGVMSGFGSTGACMGGKHAPCRVDQQQLTYLGHGQPSVGMPHMHYIALPHINMVYIMHL